MWDWGCPGILVDFATSWERCASPVLLGALIASASAATYAPLSEDELVRAAEVVFTARVLGGRAIERPDGCLETRVIVETQSVWKGRLPRRLTLVLPGGGLGDRADCSSLSAPLRQGEVRFFCAIRREDGEIELTGGPDGSGPADESKVGLQRNRRLARLAELCREQGDVGGDWRGLAPSSADLAAVEDPPEDTLAISFGSVTDSGLSEFDVPAGSGLHPARFPFPDQGDPIPYLIDMDALPEGISANQALELVEEACAVWTAATGVRFHFEGVVSFGQAVSASTAADGRIRVQLHDLHEAIAQSTTLGFGGLRLVNGGLPEGGAGGRVYAREFHRTTQGYVQINHRHPVLSDPATLTEVLCHEIGHALGLAHSSEDPDETDAERKDALMYYRAHLDGRGADLRPYDVETVERSYPIGNKPPVAPDRVLDITTHPTGYTLGHVEVNRIGLLAADLESPAPALSFSLHTSRTTSNNGSFTLNGAMLSYAASGYFDSPRLDLNGSAYYDRALYRAEDGVHASPWADVRIISFRPDSEPNPVVDGLPNDWIADNFPAGSFTDAFDDPDGDLSSTFEEYLTGTDPLDADSVLRAAFVDSDVAAGSEGGSVSVLVALDRPILRNVTIPWSVSPASTASESDYSVDPRDASPLVIPAGETSASLVFTLVEDDAPEPVETLVLDLGDPEPGVLGAISQMRITIPGDDEIPRYDFTEAAYSIPEGDGPALLESVQLQRSVATGIASSVAVHIAGSSANPAAPGVDLSAGPVVAHFSAGETVRNVPLELLGDVVFEADEEVTLTLAEFLPAGVAGNVHPNATLVLLNDDSIPFLEWRADSLVESSPEFAVHFELSHPSAFVVSFSVHSEDGSATAGDDYHPLSVRVEIPPGETVAEVRGLLIDDEIHEEDESFTVYLTELTGAETGDLSAALTLFDDDPPPILTIATTEVSEGDSAAAITGSLSAPSGLPVRFQYALLADSAVDGEDFIAVSGELTIPPGETEFAIPFVLIDNDLNEGPERLRYQVENLQGASAASPTGFVSIADDDPLPVLSAMLFPAREDDEVMSFTVNMSEPSGRTVRVRYAVESGSAADGEDFVGVEGMLEFAPGQTLRTGSFVLLNDAIYEGEESVILRLEEAEFALLASEIATGVIEDDEDAPSLTVSASPALEGEGWLRFELVLSHPVAEPVEITYAVSAGSAGTDDFVANSGMVMVESGGLDAFIDVRIIDDALNEDTENVLLMLSSDSEVILPGEAAVGLILDDDPAPALSVALVRVAESEGVAQFVVSLAAPSGRVVGFRFRTENGSAMAPDDYQERSGEGELEPGETSFVIEVPLVDDALWEEEETFRMTVERMDISEPEFIWGTATIIDDDEPASLPVLRLIPGPSPGRFTLVWSGLGTYRIESATDMLDWEEVEGADPVLVDESGERRVVLDVSVRGARFFRLVRVGP